MDAVAITRELVRTPDAFPVIEPRATVKVPIHVSARPDVHHQKGYQPASEAHPPPDADRNYHSSTKLLKNRRADQASAFFGVMDFFGVAFLAAVFFGAAFFAGFAA